MPSLQTLVSNATRQTQVEEETGQLYIPSPTREACYEAREALCHIVQDEEMCSEIHAEILPPDEYYDRLKHMLAKDFPKADPDLRTSWNTCCLFKPKPIRKLMDSRIT